MGSCVGACTQGTLTGICISSDTLRTRRALQQWFPTTLSSDASRTQSKWALGRWLLAGASTGPVCGEGERPLFTATLIHDTHLLLFFVAVVHIIYIAISLYSSLAQVRGGGCLPKQHAHMLRAGTGRAMCGGCSVTARVCCRARIWSLMQQHLVTRGLSRA